MDRMRHAVPMQTWVTEEVADWVAEHAEAEFLTVSSFLRRLVHREMQRLTEGAPGESGEPGNA